MRLTYKLRQHLNSIPPYLVLFLCLLITVTLSLSINAYVQNENSERVADATARVVGAIKSRMEHYENFLLQIRAHMSLTPNVNREDFHKYIQNVRMQERYPGVRGFAFTSRLSKSEVASHNLKMRQQGHKDFKVWPDDERDEYFSIDFIEPLDARNKKALGYDMYTDPVRRQAMEQARDSGDPTASKFVKLIQESNFAQQQSGFLIYVPVYRNGIIPSTVEGRRKELIGFVYCPFRVNDLFSSIFIEDARMQRDVHVKLYQLANQGPEDKPFFDNDSLPYLSSPDSAIGARTITVDINGQKWRVSVTPREAFIPSSERYASLTVFGCGLAFSLLLFWIFYLARVHAAEEATSRQTLEMINKASQKLSAELDLEKLVQSITDSATSLSNAQFGAFFYNVTNKNGEAMMLYTLSGVPREAFAHFPMPRQTGVFAPTFSGQSIVRSDDITKDARYGHNAPHRGMPSGHLPVKSYLAVPVISRSGEVIGGLFFGHAEAGIFTEQAEKIVAGIAAHAAVAIDNARLFEKSQDAIRARDQFLSIASHELKTPITALKLQTQVTTRQIQRTGEVDKQRVLNMCQSVDNQLNQLTRLVEDMLDITRIETGKLSLNRKKTDLSSLVGMAVDRFSILAKENKVPITVSSEKNVTVYIDSDRIFQVVTNLLSNALKYGDRKPIDIKIWKEKGFGFVSVIDSGIGIDEKDIHRIFERFERATPFQNISGLGLGLFISKQLVKAHGGDISASSTIGKGSVFTLTLPLFDVANINPDNGFIQGEL